MLAMQYSVRLPVEFDAEQVQQRVARRQPLFDQLPGLARKFYLYSEPERVYAPLYIWNDHEAAERFVLEDLFQDVVTTFGRPRVRRWTVLNYGFGDQTVEPTVASVETDKIERSLPLPELQQRKTVAHQAALARSGLYVHMVGLDSDRWEICHFALWRDAAAMPKSTADCRQIFGVIRCRT